MRISWLLIITLFAACAPKMQSGVNKASAHHSLSYQYQTYAWAKEEGTVNREHPLMDSRAVHNWVMPRIDSLLRLEGVELIEDEEAADLVVSFHWLIRSQIEDIHNTSTYAMEWYQKGTYISTQDFKEKDAALLLVRIRQRWPDAPVWSAWAAAPLRGTKPEKAFIQRAMDQITTDLAN